MTDEKALRFERDDAATLDEQVAAAQQLSGAGEVESVTAQPQAVPAKSPEAARAALRKRLTANHGNTLAYLACLKACLGDPRPYREVEESLLDNAAFGLSTQTPHTLIGLLVTDGGIERIEVAEEADGAAEQAEADTPGKTVVSETDVHAGDQVPEVEGACGPLVPCEASESASAVQLEGEGLELVGSNATEPSASESPVSVASPAGPAPERPAVAQPAPAPQPIDFLLRTTPAGRDVLAEYDVAARLERLVAGEPEGYLDAYLVVLDTCEGQGATLKQIEAALAGHPALTCPKRVYAGYFVSKLETVGAIAWQGTWHITEDGQRALEALAGQSH